MKNRAKLLIFQHTSQLVPNYMWNIIIITTTKTEELFQNKYINFNISIKGTDIPAKILHKIADKIRYVSIWSIALRVMKLPDEQVVSIEDTYDSDQRRKYEILKLWRDQHGGKKSDLLKIFDEARKENISVPDAAINCLRVSASPGMLTAFFIKRRLLLLMIENESCIFI